MILRARAFLLLLAASLLAGGCTSIDPGTYARQAPALELRRYFDGTIDGWGMVQDRSGKVLRRFTVTIEARWNGDVGTLDERFVWSDGERQRRVWTVRDLGDGRYAGSAEDVVGSAAGRTAGNALNWRYTMAIPLDGRTWHIDFDDWMFLVDDKVLINRATISKFGIRVGEVTLAFQRK